MQLQMAWEDNRERCKHGTVRKEGFLAQCRSTTPEFTWRGWGKSQEFSAKIADKPSSIRIQIYSVTAVAVFPVPERKNCLQQIIVTLRWVQNERQIITALA